MAAVRDKQLEEYAATMRLKLATDTGFILSYKAIGDNLALKDAECSAQLRECLALDLRNEFPLSRFPTAHALWTALESHCSGSALGQAQRLRDDFGKLGQAPNESVSAWKSRVVDFAEILAFHQVIIDKVDIMVRIVGGLHDSYNDSNRAIQTHFGNCP